MRLLQTNPDELKSNSAAALAAADAGFLRGRPRHPRDGEALKVVSADGGAGGAVGLVGEEEVDEEASPCLSLCTSLPSTLPSSPSS